MYYINYKFIYTYTVQMGGVSKIIIFIFLH